ncbi:MAG: yveA 2, partial [Gammaproteobacteria bacterium]|jgi:amino acid transporter|nr:yveA 2 [Gammaproteobacteria bacterium]
MALNRRFTTLSLILISVNGTIGSAWLFAPLYAARIAGNAALISWILGGLITILIALSFAELSAFLPIAGGSARFPQLTHGGLTNFIMTWLTWLSYVTMPPIEVQATLQYAATYFPSLVHSINNVVELSGNGLIWAVILMLVFSLFNISTYKGLLRFNSILFAFKIMVIIIAITAIIHTQFISTNFSGIHQNLSSPGTWAAIFSALASGGVVFAFTGFKHGVELAGETKNPKFALPVAIVGSILICLALYIGLQIAFIGSLDSTMLKSGWTHLAFPGDTGPLVGIAGVLGLAWLVKLLYADAVVSPAGAGFIYATSTARIVYGMSKNGDFPGLFSKTNAEGFPYWAVALNFVLGMVLFLPFPGWQQMVEFLVSAAVIAYAVGPVSLLCLRKQLPNAARPFRLKAAGFCCALAFYFCNLMNYWIGWETISKLGIAIAVGFAYLFVRYFMGKTDRQRFNLKAVLWVAPYLGGLVLISYLGAFGGKGYIPFGWDFVVVGIFSLVILWLALATRMPDVEMQYNAYQQEHGA